MFTPYLKIFLRNVLSGDMHLVDMFLQIAQKRQIQNLVVLRISYLLFCKWEFVIVSGEESKYEWNLMD